jgi:murein hydrolase activator
MRLARSSFCQALLLCMLQTATFAAAVDHPAGARAPADAKLQTLRARIAELTAQVAQELQRRDALSADLRNAELAIPAQREALAAVQRERVLVDQRRAQLSGERAKVQSALDAQRAEVARAVRAAYLLSRQPPMQWLLNQENPAEVGRLLTYHAYFARAQAVQIRAMQSDLARLQQLDVEIEAQATRLNELNLRAQQELSSLQTAHSMRVAALSALNRRVETATQQIERLKRDEQALESLLADLNKVAPDFNLGARRPFASMRGRLPWPVQGKLTARFREARGGTADSQVRWNGLLIQADPGAKVRAPYHGRVIYSDWLQGMGMLLIIEHGGGYLSLFGRAEVLYKRVGDTVSPGDVIASLSETAAPQLYVEIRQGRTALDPQQWLKASRR